MFFYTVFPTHSKSRGYYVPIFSFLSLYTNVSLEVGSKIKKAPLNKVKIMYPLFVLRDLIITVYNEKMNYESRQHNAIGQEIQLIIVKLHICMYCGFQNVCACSVLMCWILMASFFKFTHMPCTCVLGHYVYNNNSAFLVLLVKAHVSDNFY